MGRQLASYDNTTYTYNESGIRTSKTVGEDTTEFYLNGTNVVYQTDGETDIYFFYDKNNEVVGFKYNGSNYFYVKNFIGDVTDITDVNGNVVASYAYDPWGNVLSVTGSNAEIGNLNPFRYRSYYYDSDIQMYYLQSRYYDPEVGRFINCDDVNYIGLTESSVSYNPFAYCENNPINGSDPSGYLYMCVKITIGIVGITAAVVATVITGGAAFPALIAALKFVAGSMAISMAISGIIGWITGGVTGLKKGLINGAVDGFMWGGIGAAISAVANIIKVIQAAKAGRMLRYTKHGYCQALGRDGGKGVAESAIKYTIRNPTKTIIQSGGRIKFVSDQAVVVLNRYGQIITTWAKSRKYWR